MFPGGAAEGNKINCFPTGPVIKCLYSTKRKACNGDRRSTFAGNSALLPSDVKDCDVEVTNESARCWGGGGETHT